MAMKTTLFSAVALAFLAGNAETWSITSPDGLNEICLSTDPTLSYTVSRKDAELVASTPIALEIEGRGVLGGADLKVVKAEKQSLTGTLDTPIYKKSSIDLAARRLDVTFVGDWGITIVARNDGVAYRFFTAFNGKIKVLDEKAPLNFAKTASTFYAGLTGGHCSSWESIYSKLDAAALAKSGKQLCYLPLLAQYDDGVNMVVTESDLLAYPGWNLRATERAGELTSDFARLPDPTKIVNDQRHRNVKGRLDYLVETDGSRAFPWRTFIIADSPAKLIESDIAYAIASPNRLKGNLKWIRPGKVAWEWWNCWNVFGKDVDFTAGCNTETYKHYIDFAAETGVEYVILDEGWSVKLKIMEINPDVDVAELVRYGTSRNVGIILWCSWPQLVERQREVFSKYASLGVKGFKIDFMDRDDSFVVDFLEKTATIAAEYNLIIDYHGMYKPTGLSRTFPNILNYEGVHGLETAKFSKDFDMPGNDLKAFFTRMVAGPMDYTPGAMRYRARNLGDVGWPRKWDAKTAVFEPNWNQPDVQGTRVHQMALMSLYEAPLQMLCDSPTLYRQNMECFRFMAAVPTVWDETKGLDGKVDSFAAAARRKGDVWYAAAIASWDGAEVSIDTSFLGDGEWKVEEFSDGPNALHAPEDWRRREFTVKAGATLQAKLAPGGGWTARFVRLAK